MSLFCNNNLNHDQFNSSVDKIYLDGNNSGRLKLINFWTNNYKVGKLNKCALSRVLKIFIKRYFIELTLLH